MGGFVALFQGLRNKNKDRKDPESEPRDRNALATPAERQPMPTYETDARRAALRDLSGDSDGQDMVNATRQAFAPQQTQAPNEHDATRNRFRSMFANTAPRRY